MSSCRLSVTSNSSLSFEVRKIKFCTPTPNINAKKVTAGIFEILFWGLSYGFVLG